MDKDTFSRRLAELRINKGVSARDMSLSLGQSPGYINNIENGVNYPSMTIFFYICDYFGLSPKDFFDTETANPKKVHELLTATAKLSDANLDHLIAIAKAMK